MDTAPLTKREPALLIGFIVGLTTGAAAFFGAWGSGQDWRVAVGLGLTSFATAMGGGVLVRSQVYSPASANTIMDAHAVISEAERRGTV